MYGQEFRGTLKPGNDLAGRPEEVGRGMAADSGSPRAPGAWTPMDPAAQNGMSGSCHVRQLISS